MSLCYKHITTEK